MMHLITDEERQPRWVTCELEQTTCVYFTRSEKADASINKGAEFLRIKKKERRDHIRIELKTKQVISVERCMSFDRVCSLI